MRQKKILILIISLVILFFLTSPSMAFYEYVDENGITINEFDSYVLPSCTFGSREMIPWNAVYSLRNETLLK